jgi:hypothetical protein
LWIDVTDDMRKRKAEFHQKYVLLEGEFNGRRPVTWVFGVGAFKRFRDVRYGATKMEGSEMRRTPAKKGISGSRFPS